MLIVRTGIISEIRNCVSFWHPFFENDSLEDPFVLILRVGTFVHEVIVLFVHVKETNKIRVNNHFKHVFTVDTTHILYLILL